MMKRRIFLSAVAMTAALVLNGCSDNSDKTVKEPKQSQDLLQQIQAKGEVVIATEGTWSPWTYHDESGKLTGYDIEVGRLIAEKLGVRAHFVEGKWDGLLAGISAGRYDLMINGVDVTPERQKAYCFSQPYAYNKTVVVVSESNTTIHTMQDLKGKKTANTISSTYAEIAERYGANVVGVDDLNQTFELLLSGRIDATLNAEVVYYDYKKVHPTAPIKIAATDENVTSVAIAMKKEGTEKLQSEINRILTDLDSRGQLKELSERFFGTDISKK